MSLRLIVYKEHPIILSTECLSPELDASFVITGPLAPTIRTNGNVYSVPEQINVNNYLWTYSGTGTIIDSGAGTNTISVTYNALASNGTWTCTPQFICDNGTINSGTEATLDVTPTILVIPDDIAGCSLWLDAGQGITPAVGPSTPATAGLYGLAYKVKQWDDLSGNSNHAYQLTAVDQPEWLSATPYLSNVNKPAIFWRYASIGFNLTNSLTDPNFTFFIVMKQVTGASGKLLSDQASVGNNALIMSRYGTSVVVTAYDGTLITYPINFYNAALILCVTYDSTTGTVKTYKNNTLISTQTLTGIGANYNMIGDISGLSTPSGYTYEMIYYDNVVSTANRNSLHYYLNTKYTIY